LRQRKCVLAVALLSLGGAAYSKVVALDDPDLPIEKRMRWRVASAVAGRSANPQRIVKNVLPQIDAWIAAKQPAPTTQAGLKAGT
jgi:hypothetical protein